MLARSETRSRLASAVERLLEIKRDCRRCVKDGRVADEWSVYRGMEVVLEEGTQKKTTKLACVRFDLLEKTKKRK